MKDAIRIALGGNHMTVTAETLARLRDIQQNRATWAPSTLNRIADEILEIGSRDDTLNHRALLGYLKDLKELAADFRFLATLGITPEET